MFVSSQRHRNPLILLLLLAAAAPAQAQFGTAIQQTMLGAMDFQPQSSTTTYASSGGGYIHRTGGAENAFWARVPLPNGALIKDVCIFYYDANAGASVDVSAELSIYGLATTSSESPAFEQIAALTLSDPGGTEYSSACLLGDQGEDLVRAKTDVNGGPSMYAVYRILVRLPATDNTTRLGGALIRWQRQPIVYAQTSFTDLFTQPPGWDAAEGLYQAGISQGCGGGNFCPNDPVTRIQLAAMLWKALGLYWPE